MGLFGSDEPEGPAEILAEKAKGDSVTSKILKIESGGLTGANNLEDMTLTDVLSEDEQPHFYFYSPTKGLEKNGSTVGDGASDGYRSICIVTDERILLFASGNKGEEIPFGAIKNIETKSGTLKNKISIFTEDSDYVIYSEGGTSFEEVNNAADYILDQSDKDDVDIIGSQVVEGFQEIWDRSADSVTADEALDAKPQGNFVDRKQYGKVNDILYSDEKVHYMTRGSTVDVEGSGAGNSLFGDDRSRKSGTKGWVRAVITDRRVAVKIPQVLGDDERSVQYGSITSVDLDTGLTNKRITLQTPGQTYHIEAHEPGKDEVREAVKFIREKISEANKPDVVQAESTEPDPLEQIDKLKGLHEDGVISEEEFEEKKSDLLDQV